MDGKREKPSVAGERKAARGKTSADRRDYTWPSSGRSQQITGCPPVRAWRMMNLGSLIDAAGISLPRKPPCLAVPRPGSDRANPLGTAAGEEVITMSDEQDPGACLGILGDALQYGDEALSGAMMMLGAEDRRRLRAALDEADREAPTDPGAQVRQWAAETHWDPKEERIGDEAGERWD